MEVQPKELVIGIGDLHGHYPALEKLANGLREEYKIFSADNQLREGVELVFTGDYIDRGDCNQKVINRMIELAKNANVVELFGNHELLALADLGNAQALVGQNKGALVYGVTTLHGRNGGYNFTKEFSRDDKESLAKYVAEMSRTGRIGSWIRKLKPFHLTNSGGKSILFIHGGLSDQLDVQKDLEEYYEYFTNRILTTTDIFGGSFKKYFDTRRLGPESPFWDRTMPEMSQKEITHRLERVGVDMVVTGHTPHRKIESYFGKVFDIDVGMTPRYGENTPAAIVFREGVACSFDVLHGEVKL